MAKAIADGYIVKRPINNYVCFGSDAEECPCDNLYRIIGVFQNNVKLIKADYATEDLLGTDGDFDSTFTTIEQLQEKTNNNAYYRDSLSQNTKRSYYYWNGVNYDLAKDQTGYNAVWSYSELNKTNLNKDYLNNIGSYWSKKIATKNWNNGWIDSDVPSSYGDKECDKYLYNQEIGVNAVTDYPFEPYKAKVGLMYLSDFRYAELPFGFYYDDVQENWLSLGEPEYTITPLASSNGSSIYAANLGFSDGWFNIRSRKENNSKVVRPTFYLKASVIFAGGTGTETDPYRIK